MPTEAFTVVPNYCFRLIGKYPNTYNFTKGLTEYVLKKEYSQLPIVIVRPTTVTAAMKEPIPGWIDNLNGPTGIYCAHIYCPFVEGSVPFNDYFLEIVLNFCL